MNQLIEEKALNFLAQREHSRYELAIKLERYSFSQIDINETLDYLQSKNWLNDQRFCEEVIRSKKNKGQGPLKIQAELLRKGVDKDIIAHLIDIDDEDWGNIVTQVREKKFGQSVPDDYHAIAKQQRFLRSRGFSYWQIKQIFSE